MKFISYAIFLKVLPINGVRPGEMFSPRANNRVYDQEYRQSSLREDTQSIFFGFLSSPMPLHRVIFWNIQVNFFFFTLSTALSSSG